MLETLTTQRLHRQIKRSLATQHGRLLALAALAGLMYMQTWLFMQWQSIWSGSSSVIINGALLWLGFHQLWCRRDDLQQHSAAKDDRLAGHLLIMGGAFWLPFSRYSVSLQAMIWMVILIGVAWSSFGIAFFRRYAAASLMILVGMYPSSTFLFGRMLNALIAPEIFEKLVAWLGSQALELVGQNARASGNLIFLADKSVFVGYPCTGVDMAISLAGLGFIVGLVFKQSAWRIMLAMAAGVWVAVTFNIPRVMLMVMAVAYWGQESFDFWHGPWGGQIFSTVMFTVAYYVIAPIYSKKGQL